MKKKKKLWLSKTQYSKLLIKREESILCILDFFNYSSRLRLQDLKTASLIAVFRRNLSELNLELDKVKLNTSKKNYE